MTELVAPTESIAGDSSADNASSERVAEDGRSVWTSRWSFWLAAVGSAVGLGNLWRFPWQVANWGGGPFLLAYIASLFFIGMPILTQELALGQKNRSGDIEAFGRMHPRLRGIGLASVVGTFAVMSYYSIVIGISVVFLFASMQKDLPYGDNRAYWATDVLQLCSEPTFKCANENFSWKVYLAALSVYGITYLCVYKGVKSASKIVKITMPLPMILLLILLIRNLFLKGSVDGIKQYLDFTDWSELESVGVWDAAVGQCFFSLSVCLGVMTAYGSYNPISQDIAFDEKVVSLMDLFVSLFAGFVVYSMLGFLDHKYPEDGWYDAASFGLVFEAYPAAINEFGPGGKQIFGVLFFLVLFLLGIDSLFSMVEAVSTVIVDSDVGRQFNLTSGKVCGIVCVGGAAVSSVYCLGTGLLWLDIVDRYINNYGMVFLGICETSAVGWFYGTDRQIAKVGFKAVFAYRIGFYSSLLLALIIGFSVPEDYDYIGILIGFASWGVAYFVAASFIPQDMKQLLTPQQQVWYLAGWEGTEELRDFINTNGYGEGWAEIRLTREGEWAALWHHSTVSFLWGFLIKYFIPTILSTVLVATMKKDSNENYGGYDSENLAVGVTIFSFMVTLVAAIAFFPQILKQTGDTIDGDKNNESEVTAVTKTDDAGKATGVTVATEDDQDHYSLMTD